MEYPKPLMKTKEMRELGFSDRQLRQAAMHPLSYKYLIKTPAGKRFKWDTAEFEKYRSKILR